MTAVALVLPAFMAVPQKLPATAMGSGLLLYLERGKGAEWTELASTTTSAWDVVQDEIEGLRLRLEALRERVEASGMLRQ